MRRIAQNLAQHEPDVAIVYLGNNDSAPSRVKDAARIVRYTPLEGWLSRNFFYLLLQKVKFAGLT